MTSTSIRPVEMGRPPNLFAARKTSYKLPPTTITDKLVSQESRRNKALEEQKRRRAQRIDSSRQLDQFADLTLGVSEDEAEAEEEEQGGPAPGSVAQYAGMLRQEVDPTSIATHVAPAATSFSPSMSLMSAPTTEADYEQGPSRVKQPPTSKKKKKRRTKNKANKWADRCMYAELLEMAPAGDSWDGADGLPNDLESGWVAVGPVPVGKRCLAVSQAAVGVPGTVPHTTLRSRLLGKILIPRFPSALPAHTVLDCILDANWRENGILHVLDVVKWKGQDISECESAFRFWWRDTRLAELALTNPPAPPAPSTHEDVTETQIPTDGGGYQFPYPTTFAPIPYYTDTTLPALLTHVVPASRAPRAMSVTLPHPDSPAFSFGAGAGGEGMEVEERQWEFGKGYVQTEARVEADGLLLYVKEASYEAGTSPLSSWIPIVGYEEGYDERQGQGQGQGKGGEGPLDLFQRLVHRRLVRGQGGGTGDATATASAVEVDMEMDL
ncbi:hypothetical protein FPV67DRAFT_1669460 [Lyophyllum atratum]|nr:hypothetical protein FPV67DRAFT_1669460 [Lyophyllum atratum]